MKDMKIYKGDCLDVMKDLPGKSVHMICADLPQGITKNKWDVIIPFEPLWEQYNRVIVDNGAIVLFANQPFTSQLVMSNPKYFRYSMIWHKTSATGFLNAKKQPLRAHEDILVFYKRPPIYNPQKTTGHSRKVSSAYHKRNSVKTTNYGNHGLTNYDSTERYPTSVLKFKHDKQKSALHATQKPVLMLEWLAKTYTHEGMIILDNCAGSMSMGEACINTKRDGIMIERDDDMFNIGRNRILSLNPPHLT